jgi:hypothetical protein
MTRVKPHSKGWLAGSLGVGTIAATLLMAAFSTGASASMAAPSHARPHMYVLHASPFGMGVTRSARHAAQRPAAAPATATTTAEWVSNSAAVGNNTSCTDPGYNTISAALLAAPSSGATIKVCAGTYTEQLAIISKVNLQAQGAVTVVGPSTPSDTLTGCDTDGGTAPNQDVVDICGPGSGPMPVTINGFTIEGNWPANLCNDSLYGVAVLGGAGLNMSNSTVENIGGPALTDGCQGGVGIEVGLATGPTTEDAGTATLNNDVVTTYQKNGITVDGTGSSAKISKVTVTGAGPTPAIAQNGIQVSDGADATVTGSTVTGNECNDTSGGCGPDGFNDVQSAGILAFDSGPTTVSSTTVSGNDVGVLNVEDVAWAFFTPASPFVAAPVSFSGMTLGNRYENAFFDQGESSLMSSTLSGGEVGIEVPQYSAQTAAPQVTTNKNTITGASQDAVLVASDAAAGDEQVTLSVAATKLGASNTGGIDNQSTSVVAATGDWWGAASGPSKWSFGKGTSVSADVDFFPWATNSALTSQKTCTTATTKITTGNNVVLCATPGKNATLDNGGTGDVLLLGNNNNDHLIGSGSGETWIIGGTAGTNVINGNNGTGFIQERGDTHDTLIGTSGYTVAAR